MPRPEAYDERGQVTLMIIGFAVVLAMAVAVVTDASAAFLQRQSLDSLADGAALAAADAAASGADAYEGGLGPELVLTEADARSAVYDYLERSGAFARFPGLTPHVRLDETARRVVVDLGAPIRLPLHVPGGPAYATVGATGAADVTVDP